MKTIFLSIVSFLSISVLAQNNLENDLNKALNSSEKSNLVELVKNYPNEWLPKYYLALSEVVSVLEKENNNESSKMLDEAKSLINKLENQDPKNVEILNLKALYLTAEIVQDPLTNGGIYYPDVLETYQKALRLNPNNPRSVLGLAEFNINAANYIGTDITQDCKNVKKSLALFTNEKPKKNEPKWGKERAEELLKNQCK
jgi:tetratricopeptide (TPR) repeat protein